ncbi:MAG: DNA-directed RNA polymerase subunit omega [Candidatus Aminicenantes bacterium]|nr:DNA-directed RNA polymerase subunit omega [Candidatus Aminicenantes bacterium]
MELYGNVDSKFRYVIVAAMRAKQLIKGAKTKIEAKTKNPIRLAQAEVRAGLIDFHIIQNVSEDVVEDPSLIHAGDVEDTDDAGGGGADDGDLSDDAVIEGEEEGGIEEDLPEVDLVEEKDDE